MTDRERLIHILESIDDIENFIIDTDKELFLRNVEKRYACYGRLVTLSEAVSRLSKDFRNKYDNIEWHLITGFRNLIVHEYFRINWHIVWDIVSFEIPKFKTEIENILTEL